MHSLKHHHRRPAGEAVTKTTEGQILSGGWRYDLHEWFIDVFLFGGKGRELRQRTLMLAQLQPGDQVLDVGCGTGTLALEAQRRVGNAGHVVGIDPGSEQIARAQAKDARRDLPIAFQVGVIEQLAFPDHTFDVVLSTLMLHHLPAPLKRQGLAEIARVLKPGGRLVIADFTSKRERTGMAAHFHAGGSGLHDLAALVSDAGFLHVKMEEMPPPHLSAFPGAGLVTAHTIGGRAGSQCTPEGAEPANAQPSKQSPWLLVATVVMVVMAVSLHAIGGVVLVKTGFGAFAPHMSIISVMVGLMIVLAVFKLTHVVRWMRTKAKETA